MKPMRLITVVVLYLFFAQMKAQNLSVIKGNSFALKEGEIINLIGQWDNKMLYSVSYNKFVDDRLQVRTRLIAIDINSLKVTDSLDLFQLGYKDKFEACKLNYDKLHLIYVVPVIEKLVVKSYTVRSITMNLRLGFSSRSEKELTNFLGSKRPQFNYVISNTVIEIKSGYNTDYFDFELNKLELDGSGDHTGSFIYRDKLRDYTESVQAELLLKPIKYFYPLSIYNKKVYIESTREYNQSIYGPCKASYSDISICKFNRFNETKEQVYSLPLKSGKQILEYDAYNLKGDYVLIFGVYQEGDVRTGQMKFGVFNMLLDNNLNELTNIKYLEVFKSSKDSVHLNPSFHVIFNREQGQSFEMSYYKDYYHSYLAYRVDNPDSLSVFGYVKLDKSGNSADYFQFKNITKVESMRTDFTGLPQFWINDSTTFLIYYDHPANTGNKSNDVQDSACRIGKKNSVLSYVLFNARTGFSKRIELKSDSEDEMYLNLQTFLDIASVNNSNDKSTKYWLIPAYNKDKTVAAIYRLKVTQ